MFPAVLCLQQSKSVFSLALVVYNCLSIKGKHVQESYVGWGASIAHWVKQEIHML